MGLIGVTVPGRRCDVAYRSWPVAANPVSGAATWESPLTQTLLPVSVTTAGVVTWTGGATADKWPVAVNPASGAVTYS
jgi:hypothetical protein